MFALIIAEYVIEPIKQGYRVIHLLFVILFSSALGYLTQKYTNSKT